jgi:hypothetical protein
MSGPPPGGWGRWTPLLLALVAAVWTWPALVSPGILGHNPDAPGTVWFISAGGRLIGGADPLTGWPVGATYGRPDSYLLMALSPLTALVSAARLHALLGLVGVWASAWAAEAFARALGARAPWSLLAGLAFACSGLGSTALLEGYAYHTLDPWLPLLGLALLRATAPDGRAAHGVAVALTFLLCLLSTAWLGLAALVLLLGLGAAGALRLGRRLPWQPALAALLTVAAPLALYLRAFAQGGGGGEEALRHAGGPSAALLGTLVRLAAALPSVDVSGNSQTAVLPGLSLALLAVAPVVLRGERGWRGVAGTGLAALALTLLPALGALVPDGLLSVLTASLQRFPERLGWTFLLCAGAVGARVATALADRQPRAAWGLVVFALGDAFLLPRMPIRQRETLALAPSVYAEAEGPVLDLWPENVEAAPGWELRTTNLGCAYQAVHHRPIADLCVASPGVPSPRVVLGRWALSRLFAGDAEGLRLGLGELGFTTLVVHTDVFSEGDLARLSPALAALDPAALVRTDGGERVVAAAIPASPSAADPRERAAAWARFSP